MDSHRPLPVKHALTALWTALAFGAVLGVINIAVVPIDESGLNPAMTVMMADIVILTTIITLILEAFLILMIGRRRNWARITYLVLFALGLPLLLFGLFGANWGGLAGLLRLLSLLLTLTRILALVWLFGRAARDWFHGSNGTSMSIPIPSANPIPSLAAMEPTLPETPIVPVMAPTTAAPHDTSAMRASPTPTLDAFIAGRQLGLRAEPAALPIPPSVVPTNSPPLTTTATHPGASPTRGDLRHGFESAASAVRLWLVLLLAACGIETMVLILFANKVRQTSEWALRYSRQTQEEVGQWVIAITLVGVAAVVLLLLMLVARGARSRNKAAYAAALHEELAQARTQGDVAGQVACESELRRIGA